MNKEDVLHRLNSDTSDLSRLINSWNLVSGSSNSTFIVLARKIVNHLYSGQDELKIKRVLQSEFSLTFGLFANEFDSGKFSKEIILWWNAKH